jgi:threonine dehydratase
VPVPRDDPELEPAAIRAAAADIDAVFTASPQFVHEDLSERAGRPVIVKVETVNPIGAFKGRGTWLVMRRLAGEGRVGPARACVVASTGNFGQGIAYAGRAFGVPVVVFAQEAANRTKLDRIARFGAEVVTSGRDFDEAREASARYAIDHDATLVVDGELPAIAAGAGTMAVEVSDGVAAGRLPPIGSAYVPVGNGALVVGIGAWLRSAAPDCRVVGVQSDAAPSMTLSWRAGKPVETDTAETFADGIASRVPVPEALEMMRGRVDDMTLVSESDLHAAQAELRQALGITVEGAAAASWAGILADPAPPAGAALLIITGSNAAG